MGSGHGRGAAGAISLRDPSGKAACRTDLATRHGLDAGGPIFGLVGRLDPQKGFDLVAGGAQALIDAGPA